jgi:class 3 adenylate cyclase
MGAEAGDELTRLREENERLRAELKRMHDGARFSSVALGAAGGMASLVASSHQGRSTGTVLGIEEMVLQVNPDRTIGYLNAPMARLLGIQERRAALGEALEKWDRGPLGEGTVRSVVESALAAGSGMVVERLCPGLDVSLLPAASGPRPACEPILRFVANPIKGRVELVAQDVTRLRWLESTFARYVAPEVIAQMLARPADTFMEMERRTLTVLFADLRGFTRLTQQLEPRQLREMINEFLSSAVEAIGAVDGTVDKFVGDEVMALFGAPLPMPDHALRGLMAGLGILKRHAALVERWAGRGLPTAGVGLGVCTGEVFVGNLGTETRMEYTAIGHSVNLAARLCGAAGPGELLTVGETYQACAEAIRATEIGNVPRFKFSPRGKQSFKNVEEPVTVLGVSEV